MRDAMVASTTLDICHKYSDRLKMTNIAQMVNVLQAMVLTQGEKMLLTPTYYVYKMYTVHQGATFLPVEVSTATKEVRGGRGKATRTIPLLSATASRDGAGKVHISLSNLDADNAHEVTVDLEAVSKSSKAVGEILASKNITDHNEFGKPEVVKAVPFKDFRFKGGQLTVKMPAASIVTIELQ
jgi:alpha-N-arabinofuranosidase